MSARWPNIAVWTLAFGSALLWSYALTRPSKAATAPPRPVVSAFASADLSRVLGADPPPTPVAAEAPPMADARMQLIGVVSPSSEEDAEEGLALIAINGQPAKVYRVGMVVDGESVLQAVEARGARLGPLGGATLIALHTAPLGSVPEGAPSAPMAAPMAAPMPMPMAPPSVPQQMPVPTASADGTPPPFGGPPQAFGGAPPAPPRRAGTR